MVAYLAGVCVVFSPISILPCGIKRRWVLGFWDGGLGFGWVLSVAFVVRFEYRAGFV